MSVAEAQARVSELRARMQSLAPQQAAYAASTARTSTATGTSGTEFASNLQKALAAQPLTPTASVGSTAAAGATTTADAVIASAKEHLGTPYVWGGSKPGGFDCSGFLQYVFKQHGIELPRVSKDQAKVGVAVSPADARPGDIVAMDNSRARAGIDHIGMYIGNGEWIVAPKSGDVVKIQKVDLSKAVAIRRVLPDAGIAALTPSAASGVTSAAAPDWASDLPVAGRRYIDEIQAAARKTGVDPRLLASVAWSESGFSPTARSGAGAVGLMQLMPATARGLGVDPTDPAQALVGGGTYLAQQLQKFGGRVDLALAAYNAGPGAVRKHGGIPPYAETQTYVTRVLDRFQKLGGSA